MKHEKDRKPERAECGTLHANQANQLDKHMKTHLKCNTSREVFETKKKGPNNTS